MDNPRTKNPCAFSTGSLKPIVLFSLALLVTVAFSSCASFTAEASVDTLTGHAKVSFKSEQFTNNKQ